MADDLKEDIRLIAINKALNYLLGSSELKEKWWASRNKAFDMKTPTEVYNTDPSRVSEYIISMLKE